MSGGLRPPRELDMRVVSELSAENERLRDVISDRYLPAMWGEDGSLERDGWTLVDEGRLSELEADSAALDRVRTLCDEWQRHNPLPGMTFWECAEDVRAALDGDQS